MASSGGWQAQVGVVPAPALAGDFASKNPRFTVDAGPGGLVAGSLGCTVGYFAWATSQAMDADNAPAVVNSFGSGPVTGFIAREQQGLIVLYLDNADNGIPKGFPVTLHNGGDFWVQNDGTTTAVIGNKAYADLATGKVSFGATATASTASITGSIAAATAQFSATVSGNVLTVISVASGTITPGSVVTGTIVTGTHIVTQLSGSTGRVGTYALDTGEQTLSTATTLNSTYGVLTVSATASGTVAVGGLLAAAGGTAITTGTVITGLGPLAGGSQTYYVNNTQTAASTAITVTQNVETKWVAMSSGLTGELVKISDHLLG
jgi:hypothetical protein